MADADGIDESLLVRVSAMSRGSQRWLKTTIQAVRSGAIDGEDEADIEERATPQEAPARNPSKLQRQPANLEDVITGKADLREQLEAYPELSNELEGLADVIDLLREAGERRRKRGEEVLRELLEGDGAPPGENAEGEHSDESGGGEPPRHRPRR